MGVLLFDEQPGLSGRFARGDDGPTADATRRFIAQTALGDSFVAVLAYRETPKVGDRLPSSPLLVCVDVRAEEHEDKPGIWDVVAEYDSQTTPERAQNPLARPAEFDWDDEEQRQIIEFDGAGDPIINTAGDLIEGVEDDVGMLVCRVSKNLPRIPQWVLRYRGAVNSDAVRVDGLTFPPQTLRLKRLRRGRQQIENDVRFYALSFELHYKQTGWFKRLANRGYHELEKQADGSRIKQRIGVGDPPEPPAEPQWLDAEGQRPRNDAGEVKTPRDPDNPLEPADLIFLTYPVGQRLPFSALPLR